MATPSEHERRISELEAALQRERARSTELERRAAALEDSARRAWQMAAGGAPRRDRADTV